MKLRIVFEFKDCKLQFYEKRRFFSYFSVNPRTPASRWHRLLKLKRININSFKIIIGFFFTPPLFLATKVAISFVYYSPKTIKCTQKPKIEKKFYRNRPIEQTSERVPFSTSYLQLALAHARNSRVKNCLFHRKEFLIEPPPENTRYTFGVILRKCNDFQNKGNNRQIFE